jgi:IS5 family transposase
MAAGCAPIDGETDIHHRPTAHIVGQRARDPRLVGRLDEVLAHGVGEFPNRTRRARRRMQEIQRMTPTQRQRHQRRKYRDLIRSTEEVIGHAREVLENTRKVRAIDALRELAIQGIRSEIAHYCALGLKVIAQARRRVLEKQPVPNAEKIYSIFEPSNRARCKTLSSATKCSCRRCPA